MTAIRVVFDGKAFVPQQPVSLPPQAEGLVIVEQSDASDRARLHAELRQYYQQAAGDADDDAWANATTQDSHRAWDED